MYLLERNLRSLNVYQKRVTNGGYLFSKAFVLKASNFSTVKQFIRHKIAQMTQSVWH